MFTDPDGKRPVIMVGPDITGTAAAKNGKWSRNVTDVRQTEGFKAAVRRQVREGWGIPGINMQTDVVFVNSKENVKKALKGVKRGESVVWVGHMYTQDDRATHIKSSPQPVPEGLDPSRVGNVSGSDLRSMTTGTLFILGCSGNRLVEGQDSEEFVKGSEGALGQVEFGGSLSLAPSGEKKVAAGQVEQLEDKDVKMNEFTVTDMGQSQQ